MSRVGVSHPRPPAAQRRGWVGAAPGGKGGGHVALTVTTLARAVQVLLASYCLAFPRPVPRPT